MNEVVKNEKVWDIVLLTESRYLVPDDKDQYLTNILEDDRIFIQSLESFGLKVVRKDWADPDFYWESTSIALFRTTWDYFDRWKEFFSWFQATSEKCLMVNSYETILWNTDKIYLSDLENKGVRIVDSIFITKGNQKTLTEIVSKTSWNKFVLKPNISGAARHTYLIDSDTISTHEKIYKKLISEEDMMIQDFQNSILDRGEVSHIVIDGKYSHSILKQAKTGDFRVQDDFGGSIHSYEANSEEISFSENVVIQCGFDPLYARVDVIWNNNNDLALSELELIEPELWFRYQKDAAKNLSSAIKKKHF